MRVLLSAYACEPDKGSEPAVGWHWAVELARLGHEVWVLTRSNNRATIEAGLRRMPEAANLRFLYYDLPAWARWWKKGRRGIHLYYLLWQWGAYRLARQVNRRAAFDRVHHVTLVSVRQPSFMGRLGIPFIFGPVAGGERAPWRLRWGYGWHGLVVDALRDILNRMVPIDPLMRRTFRAAEKIYVTSEQTLDLIPRRFHEKTAVQLAIGWRGEGPETAAPHYSERRQAGRMSVLYVGQLIYLKGLHLGLSAFQQLLGACPDARLVIVGGGPDQDRLQRLAAELGLGDRVEWLPWVAREDVLALYQRHDIFLFPSLHDSGGMVVLEALGAGLPVVCLDLGGPGAIVDESCGRAIGTEGRSAKSVSQSLGAALTELASNHQLRRRLSLGAVRRVRSFGWARLVQGIYGEGSH